MKLNKGHTDDDDVDNGDQINMEIVELLSGNISDLILIIVYIYIYIYIYPSLCVCACVSVGVCVITILCVPQHEQFMCSELPGVL